MSSVCADHEFRSLPGADVGFSTFFYQLFINGQYTDIYFNLKYEGSDSCFSAHKFVLTLRSAYFADMFASEDKSANFIPLSGINPVYFKAMLSYMYDYMPSMRTPEEICGIYKVAKEFSVISLMNVCHEKLNNFEVTPSNMFDMLKAADFMQNVGTKNRCLNVFQANTKEVFVGNYELSEISPSIISFLLTSKKLCVKSLFDLFIWVFAWAERRYKTDNRFNSPREALDEFLSQLPFASLKVEEFAELYRCHPDFFSKDEVIQIFMNYALRAEQMPDWYNKECEMEIRPIGQS